MTFHPYPDPARQVSNAIEKGKLTLEDGVIINEYIREYRATRQISPARVHKTISNLIGWCRFLPALDTDDYLPGISAVMAHPFSQNMKHDYIRILKQFMAWRGIDVKKIRVPRQAFDTSVPSDLLTEDEVVALVRAGRTSRDRALVALVYETGCRINEAARLRWKDLREDDHGLGVYITDTKTQKMRYTRIVAFAEYLAAWKMDSFPGDTDLVFRTARGDPMGYNTMNRVLRVTVRRAGIAKRVHWHLLRKSRITHAVKKNIPESILKKMFWGNLDTSMFKTYVVLSESDIDRAILADAGLVKPVPADDPLRPRTCPHCTAVNAPTHPYCSKCGYPLDPDRIAAREAIREIARNNPAGFLEMVKELLKA
jgi:integrase/recombinase XerD